MREVDSIKKKEKRIARPNRMPEIVRVSETAPEPVAFVVPTDEEIKPVKISRLSPSKKRLIHVVTLTTIIVSLAIFARGKIILASEYAGSRSDKIKTELIELEEALRNNDIDKAFEVTTQLREDSDALRYSAQSLGQDITYFRLVGMSGSSNLSKDELLLDSLSHLLNITSRLGEGIKDLQSKVVFGKDHTSSYIVDIKSLRFSLLNIIIDSEKELNDIQINLADIKDGSMNKYDNIISNTSQNLTIYKSLFSENFSWLGGEDGKPKNILIVFQNNAELRGGSGGSLGSFGIARFNDGKLEKIDFGTNIFKLDQSFEKDNKIEPPDIIKFLRGNKSWTMKDSGWSVDGPSALQNISDFYFKETGEKVDGVMTLDATAIEMLLEKIDPIKLPEYDTVISAQNFRSELEQEVHEDYFDRPGNSQENEPKKIIADLMPEMLSQIFSSMKDEKSVGKILTVFNQALKQKDILLYFNNKNFQRKIDKFGYSGKVAPAVGDYLYINNSNIDGMKSSLSIEEYLTLESTISDQGEIDDNLMIGRKHNGTMTWPDGLNTNFVRLLLPENSNIKEFKPVSGDFEQFHNKGLKDGKYFWQESSLNKTIINFWMTTKPGEESKTEINYQPNYKISTENDFTYTFQIQKQPGASSDDLDLKLHYPKGFVPQNVKNYDTENNLIELKIKIDTDKTIAIRFKKM